LARWSEGDYLHREIQFISQMSVDYPGLMELLSIEKSLANYNSDIVSKLSCFSKNGEEVLEFGAGIGTLAEIWKNKFGSSPECLEIDSKMAQILKNRGFVCYQTCEEITKKYDKIYSSNVLEHIEDDVLVIKKLHNLLKEGGLIAIYVPAFSILYSGLDLSVGHVRRYSKKDLLQKLTTADFKIVECHFADSIGFFASLALKFFGYRNNPKTFLFYDRYLYPLSKFLDQLGLKHFFGKNLLVIAQKK
jgi:SAM-dependent methyltransferase